MLLAARSQWQPVTMHDDTFAKQGARLELIAETVEKHLYGWQGDSVVLDFSY
jgi:hypothetical protein